MAEHPNAALLRKGYDAFSKGDMETIRGIFAEDIRWHITGDSSLSGDYKGIDEVFGFFGKLATEMDGGLSLKLHDILANDEHAVALIDSTSTRKGQSRNSRAVHIWHVQGGKAVEFWDSPLDQAGDDAFLNS